MATKKKRKRTSAAIGRQNRARGGAYERYVAKQMTHAFPGARRGIGQARSGGDVPDVEGCGPYWIQCKSTRAPNLFAALAQAEDELNMRRLQQHAACPYSVPLAVARRTGRSGDVVAMRLSDFVAVLTLSRIERDALSQQLLDPQQDWVGLRRQLDAAVAAAPPALIEPPDLKPESET